jgi:hypothetical protein
MDRKKDMRHESLQFANLRDKRKMSVRHRQLHALVPVVASTFVIITMVRHTQFVVARSQRWQRPPWPPGCWSRKGIWGTPQGHLAIGRPNKNPNVCRRRPGKMPIGSTVTHVLCNSTIGADAVIGPSLPRIDAALGNGFSYVYCATMYHTVYGLILDVTGRPRHDNV